MQSKLIYILKLFPALILSMLMATSLVFAQDDDDVVIGNLYNEFDYQSLGGMEGRLAPHGDGLMGDMIDKNSGGLVFEHMDVSVPGNSGLEVALRRKRTQGSSFTTPYQQGFGDWLIDLPIAHIAYGIRPSNPNPPQFSGGCLNYLGNLQQSIYTSVPGGPTLPFSPESHVAGVVLHVPGKGLSGFPGSFKTPSDPSLEWKSGPRTTDHEGRCATVVVAPDGTKYKFGRHVFRKADPVYMPVEYPNPSDIPGAPNPHSKAQYFLNRNYAVYLVTEVEDVNGHWVRYEYDNSSRAELTRIYSNDGREINLNYESFVPNSVGRNSRRITDITTNSRTWTYAYSNASDNSFRALHTVTLPDGRFWRLGDNVGGMAEISYITHQYYKCLPYDHTFDMKHPDGAIGTFRVRETRHIKGAENLGNNSDDAWDHFMQPTDIPFATDNSECSSGTLWPNGKAREKPYERPDGWPIYRTMSIASKSISGVGIPTATWDFEYRNYSGGSLAQNWTKITGPDGTEQTYTHQAIGANHGLLKSVDVNPTSGAGETITYDHEQADSRGTGSCTAGGIYGDTSGLCFAYYKRPVTKATQQRDGDTYTTETSYNFDTSSTDYAYGYPVSVKSYSNVSTSARITNRTYEHNTNKWVLGLPKTVTRNGRELASYSYNTLGQKISQTRYGQPYITFGYHTNAAYKGALYWVRDSLGRRTYALDYKRGTPQRIRRADTSNIYRYVDNNGWVTSHKDAMGRTTNYTRDNMGRLRLVNPTGSWTNTSIDYTFNGGGAVQTIQKGLEQIQVTYDRLFRPVLERNKDLGTGWVSYTNTEYDATGRVSFNSFPSTSASETAGTYTTYDGLNRLTSSDTAGAITDYTYFSGHRKRITDPESNATTYRYTGYEGPGRGALTHIYQPMGVNTVLSRDVHDQLNSVRQYGNHNGFNESQYNYYYYDNQYRLCRHRTPEGGDTVIEYDGVNRIKWTAKGQAASSSCNINAVASSERVTPTYNDLDWVTYTAYPEGTPDVSMSYDANGNVLTTSRDDANWTYTYDDLNHLDSERLIIDGRTYQTSYTYNAQGKLSSQETPANRTINFSPDAFGRATRASVGSTHYASGITYHPTGQVNRINYGNDFIHTQTFNNRRLPETLHTYRGGTNAVHLTYAYDSNGRISSITDLAVTGQDKNFGYDGLGRLTSADGSWGVGNFTYDPLGNLRNKQLGERNVEMQYDSNNRLSKARDTDDGNVWRNYVYDTSGNVTNNGKFDFTYDHANQPTAMSREGGDFLVVMSPSFYPILIPRGGGTHVYDGNYKRVKSVVRGKTTYSVYSVNGKLLHRDKVSENKKTDYINAAGQTVARIENSTVTYPHNDLLGSPASASSSSGSIEWREYFTPFGEKLENPTANRDNVGFTGHVQDDATGLTYMQARYHDPVIGRFLSIDPVTFKATSDPRLFGRYHYAFNDPINATDPDGKLANFLVGGIVGGVAAGLASYIAGADGRDIALAIVGGATVGALTSGASVFIGSLASTAGAGASTSTAIGVVAASTTAGAAGNALGQGVGMGVDAISGNEVASFDGKQVAMAGGIAAIGSFLPALAASSEVGLVSNLTAPTYRAVLKASQGSLASEVGLATHAALVEGSVSQVIERAEEVFFKDE